MTMVAEARGVWKRYGRTSPWLLRDIDLALPSGTVTVVLGGNGTGKSTLLRVVAGVSVATKGRVRRPRRSVSYLPEVLPANVRFRPDRYLQYMAGLRPGPVLERSREILGRLELSSDRPMAELSKGNRQKVLLAQALGCAAELTVLDEPFSGLDKAAAVELTVLLADARSRGRSVLISSHQALDADAGYRLEGGQLRAISSEPLSLSLSLIVLRASARSVDLARIPGVRTVTDDPETSTTRVVTSDPDGLLRAALTAGWSFIRGGPQ